MYDVIIIGAGMAGLTAAIYAKRAGRSVLVLESQMRGGQIVTSAKVTNWPGLPDISGAELMKTVSRQVSDLGVETRYEKVISVVKNNKMGFVVKTDEGEYAGSALIIATGTEPKKLPEKQAAEAEGKPILYCATCDGALYAGKPVAVVGGGNTAKHEVSYLSKIASKVHPVHRNDVIPKEVAAVFVAIGRAPRTDFLKGLVELDKDGYIAAGEDCHTSLEGVFAAGDCRTKLLRQLVTAASDGAMAASEATSYISQWENK